MNIMLYIDDLDTSTTDEELRNLFMQVGEIIAIKINRDQVSGTSKGFGFITMSAHSEADKAVSGFNSYPVSDHKLKVRLAMPGAQHGTTSPIIEP